LKKHIAKKRGQETPSTCGGGLKKQKNKKKEFKASAAPQRTRRSGQLR